MKPKARESRGACGKLTYGLLSAGEGTEKAGCTGWQRKSSARSKLKEGGI